MSLKVQDVFVDRERMAGGEREKELIEAVIDDWDCDDRGERYEGSDLVGV